MEVLSDPENGSPMDKLRLFLIYFLCTPAVSDAEYDQYAGALQVDGMRNVLFITRFDLSRQLAVTWLH